MKRFVASKPQLRFKATYPLIQIDQLRSKKKFDIGETATIPIRDYYEWMSLPYIMKHETFFTRREKFVGNSIGPLENLLLYDPILTHCIAKWLLVDYKLNSYPYNDLNIISVFTDLPQALQIAKSMMTYFQMVLSVNMFERIKYFMIPLYDHKSVSSSKLLEGLPGEVRIIADNAVFSSEYSNKMDPGRPFIIEDPVYVLMLNDVIKNTSHDLVRYSAEKNYWEQCYMDINIHGDKTKRFDSEMDYWCNIALKKTLDKYDYSMENKTKEILIPTRLVQLFEILRACAPEHKLFAVDIPQRWNPGFFSMIKLLFGYAPLRASTMVESQKGSIWKGQGNDSGPTFTTDFTQIQQLYMSINESGKLCEVEDMSDFVDRWVDLSMEQVGNSTKDKLESQLEMINTSSLAILHSS